MTYEEFYGQVKEKINERDWHKNVGTFEELFEAKAKKIKETSEEIPFDETNWPKHLTLKGGLWHDIMDYFYELEEQGHSAEEIVDATVGALEQFMDSMSDGDPINDF